VNQAIEPMVTVGVRVPVNFYRELVTLAQERGLVTSKGRPNVSAAARAVLGELLGAGEDDQAEGVRDD
jgi:hypothetical protein